MPESLYTYIEIQGPFTAAIAVTIYLTPIQVPEIPPCDKAIGFFFYQDELVIVYFSLFILIFMYDINEVIIIGYGTSYWISVTGYTSMMLR